MAWSRTPQVSLAKMAETGDVVTIGPAAEVAVPRRDAAAARARLRVGADGSPGTVQIVRSSGYWRLDHAALSALERARFVPAQRDGQPVAAIKEVLISFRLEDGAS